MRVILQAVLVVAHIMLTTAGNPKPMSSNLLSRGKECLHDLGIPAGVRARLPGDLRYGKLLAGSGDGARGLRAQGHVQFLNILKPCFPRWQCFFEGSMAAHKAQLFGALKPQDRLNLTKRTETLNPAEACAQRLHCSIRIL